MKLRLVQVLCGAARHSILALPYMPGLTAAQSHVGAGDDITLDEGNAAEYVRGMVDGLIEMKGINPWCELCGSRHEQWKFEDAATKFDSLEEALPFLRLEEAKQLVTAKMLKEAQQAARN